MATARKILFSAVKNEAPFLVEWIAYHKTIGFDRIIIASNDSDDGTTELLDALDEAGGVHHIHHHVTPRHSPQGRAAERANASGLIADGDWVIWLDADEFLNIHAGAGHVDDLIAAMGDAAAMLISWRLFGDAGCNDPGPWRFVSAMFDRASQREIVPNSAIKTFYRYDRNLMRLSHKSPHRPRIDRQHTLAEGDVITSGGHPMDMAHDVGRRWMQGVDSSANSTIPMGEVSWALAQINHYSVRTRDLFQLKKLRGRGYRNRKRKGGGIRHDERFFDKHNRNEAEDRSILRHADPTSAEIDRLLRDDAVRRAHENGLQLTAARIAAMKSDSPAPPGPEAQPEVFAPEISMPAAEADFLRTSYGRHDVILEYGTGGSTRFAASGKHSLIMGVESDADWAQSLETAIRDEFPAANLHLHHVDIGRTRKWGYPAGDREWRNFHLYPQSVWNQPWFRHPDLVLIDGRFRVGCLLTTLFRITRPVTVLFDDYIGRPQYAAMLEGFAEPDETIGRMAVFHLEPTPIPAARMTDIVSFLSVPD